MFPHRNCFKRFKKSNQSQESIGLGLSIVKQICEVNDFSVHYDFADGWHSITVYFDNTKVHNSSIFKRILAENTTAFESVEQIVNFAK